MLSRRLLYLSAYQLSAFRWRSGAPTLEASFSHDESGYRQFSEYLTQHRRNNFSLLVNIAEEGFQVESIPFLRGADRATVIRRKLSQVFFSAPLTSFLSLGYEKNQRKDERLLLASLNSSEHLAPWLRIIAQTEIALAGIYSLPLLAPALFRRMKISESRCLLLSVQDQSIRQSYLENGEIHFSRLAPLFDSSIVGIAQAFSSETLKLQQYISSQRLISRNQPITAYLLAHPGAVQTIREGCVNSDNIRYEVLDLAQVSRRVGLSQVPENCNSELLFLHLMAIAPSRLQFADDALRHSYHLRLIRRGLYSLGAVALLGALVTAVFFFQETARITQEAQDLHSDARQLRQRLDELIRSQPAIPANHDTLRHIIDRFAELERQSSTPDGLYLDISHALQGVPAVELEAIEWNAAGGGDNARSAATERENAVIHGFLRLNTHANPRQMLATFAQFVTLLQANPALQVEVLQRPLDIESGKSLKDADTSVEDNKPRAFSLRIIRKTDP